MFATKMYQALALALVLVFVVSSLSYSTTTASTRVTANTSDNITWD